jgi:hypothetical protein
MENLRESAQKPQAKAPHPRARHNFNPERRVNALSFASVVLDSPCNIYGPTRWLQRKVDQLRQNGITKKVG